MAQLTQLGPDRRTESAYLFYLAKEPTELSIYGIYGELISIQHQMQNDLDHSGIPLVFCFILLTHEGSHKEVYQILQPSYDISRMWCQGLIRL